MKLPTIEEFAVQAAEKALDEYVYEGKTLRQWVEILKDYDDKQSTLQNIVEKLKEEHIECEKCPLFEKVFRQVAFEEAIAIVKEVGGMNERA